MEWTGNAKAAVEARRRAWTERLESEVSRMVALLRERPDVEKVILSGSLARGRARARSDIDLVIIQNTDKPFLDRLGDFYAYLSPKVETDLLVYTPREWEELPSTRSFFRRLRNEGVVLHDAQRS